MPKILSNPLPSVHKYSLELEVCHKDGHLLWIEDTLSFIRDKNGKPTFLLGETRDITERKRAEEELRESEYKYKSLIENIPDIIFTIDLEGKITFVSKRAKEILGYEDAETINKYLFNFIPEEDRQEAVENLQKGMKGEKIKHIQTPVIAKSGEKVFFDCSFTRIYKDGAVVGAQGTAADITERKLAEMALKKSEERYRSVFANAGLPLVIMEASLPIFMVNDRFVEMSGYGKDEIEGQMKFTDFIVSGDRNALMRCFSRRKGDKPVEYECRIAHRNGEDSMFLSALGTSKGQVNSLLHLRISPPESRLRLPCWKAGNISRKKTFVFVRPYGNATGSVTSSARARSCRRFTNLFFRRRRHRPMSSFTESRERAKNWWPRRSTRRATEAEKVLSLSIAEQFRKHSWRANFSDTKKEPLPAPTWTNGLSR